MLISAIPPLNYGRDSNRPYDRVCAGDDDGGGGNYLQMIARKTLLTLELERQKTDEGKR